MQETIDALVQMIADNGGAIDYATWYEGLTYPEQRAAYRTLRMAEGQGVLHRSVQVIDGNVVYELRAGERPPVNQPQTVQ